MIVREGLEAVDFNIVQSWLTKTYWSPGISLERVAKAAQNSSLVVTAYIENQLIGYMRVVSDKTTFAWVCDVYVDETARGKGVAKAMVRFALAHPDHQGLRRWLLATKDAHGVYRDCGFEDLWEPERWMSFFPAGTPATKVIEVESPPVDGLN
ncbi:GNAT family N-acetyltransferase [soil metagenome]